MTPYEPWASSPAARRTMQGNKRKDTKPELAVRRRLHAMGLRYRVDARPLPEFNRRADMVFSRARVAVFIDGCYWHGCPEHGTRSKTNVEYWGPKIQRNIERDRDTDTRLGDAGWTVLRFWEHEPPESAAGAIAATVKGQRSADGRQADP